VQHTRGPAGWFMDQPLPFLHLICANRLHQLRHHPGEMSDQGDPDIDQALGEEEEQEDYQDEEDDSASQKAVQPSEKASAVAFRPAHQDQTPLFDAVAFRQAPALTVNAPNVTCFCALPDGLVLTGGEDGSVRCWDARDGHSSLWGSHGVAILSIFCLPDAHVAVSVCAGQVVCKWDLRGAGRLLARLRIPGPSEFGTKAQAVGGTMVAAHPRWEPNLVGVWDTGGFKRVKIYPGELDYEYKDNHLIWDFVAMPGERLFLVGSDISFIIAARTGRTLQRIESRVHTAARTLVLSDSRLIFSEPSYDWGTRRADTVTVWKEKNPKVVEALSGLQVLTQLAGGTLLWRHWKSGHLHKSAGSCDGAPVGLGAPVLAEDAKACALLDGGMEGVAAILQGEAAAMTLTFVNVPGQTGARHLEAWLPGNYMPFACPARAGPVAPWVDPVVLACLNGTEEEVLKLLQGGARGTDSLGRTPLMNS
jgi:hypothetical protein